MNIKLLSLLALVYLNIGAMNEDVTKSENGGCIIYTSIEYHPGACPPGYSCTICTKYYDGNISVTHKNPSGKIFNLTGESAIRCYSVMEHTWRAQSYNSSTNEANVLPYYNEFGLCENYE